MPRPTSRGALVAFFAVACGCADATTTVDDPSCGEGVRWQGTHASIAPEGSLRYDGEHTGSPLMHPGRQCVACHASNAKAPALVIGGTVYRRADDASDCAGVPGARVELTDARGVAFERTTNATGNFHLQRSEARDFVMPYRTKVTFAGKTYAMFPATDNGDCNSCHTPSGAQQAQGRACVDATDARCTH